MAAKKNDTDKTKPESEEAAGVAAGEVSDKAAETDTAEKVSSEGNATETALPENAAVDDPAPTDKMDPASGAFVEPAVLDVGADHPAVENHPRAGTTAVQNGIDWNDPLRDPTSPDYVGQGVDESVYGKKAAE